MHSLVRFETAVRVPSQAAREEIQECLIIALQGLLKCLRAWTPSFALGRDGESRLAKRVEEELLASTLLNQVLVWRSKDFHDASQLLLLILSWENWITGEKFGEDASQAPHVNRHSIGHA